MDSDRWKHRRNPNACRRSKASKVTSSLVRPGHFERHVSRLQAPATGVWARGGRPRGSAAPLDTHMRLVATSVAGPAGPSQARVKTPPRRAVATAGVTREGHGDDSHPGGAVGSRASARCWWPCLHRTWCGARSRGAQGCSSLRPERSSGSHPDGRGAGSDPRIESRVRVARRRPTACSGRPMLRGDGRGGHRSTVARGPGRWLPTGSGRARFAGTVSGIWLARSPTDARGVGTRSRGLTGCQAFGSGLEPSRLGNNGDRPSREVVFAARGRLGLRIRAGAGHAPSGARPVKSAPSGAAFGSRAQRAEGGPPRIGSVVDTEGASARSVGKPGGGDETPRRQRPRVKHWCGLRFGRVSDRGRAVDV